MDWHLVSSDSALRIWNKFAVHIYHWIMANRSQLIQNIRKSCYNAYPLEKSCPKFHNSFSYDKILRWLRKYLTFCVGFHLSDASSPLKGSSFGGWRMEIQTSPFLKSENISFNCFSNDWFLQQKPLTLKQFNFNLQPL